MSGVGWYGHVLRTVLDFEAVGRTRLERLNMTLNRQVEEHTNQIGVKKEDAIDRTKCHDDVYKLSKNMR